jgi:acetyl-CoA carboxylase carboxyl transferase subunit alpha
MELEFEKPLAEIEAQIATLKQQAAQQPDSSASPQIIELEQKRNELEKSIYASLTPWQTVQVARHPDRPRLDDYLAGVFSEYIELHGDRTFGDDPAITGGFATIDKYRVMVIGHQKGKTVEENIKTRFGMGNPEGYRKALRLMKLAEKYAIPVVCFVDTPGAYPGLEAEARGQAEAIARNLTVMARLETPMIVVVTGEGGSGGALGIAVGDVILMLSNAIYSVISPEGCASILWRDGAKAPDAAEALKLTARSLLELRVIDGIVEEPAGGAHRHPAAAIGAVKDALLRYLRPLRKTSPRKLVKRRYDKFAAMGRFGRR